MIKVILGKLAKQKSTSPHLGALINAYTSAAILYAPLTFLGVVTTVYGLWGAEQLRAWYPWFEFWHLVAIMVLFILVAMVAFYKVVVPSVYAFQVQQQYKHRNPLVADMQKVLKMLDETKVELRKTNERLEKLEKLGKRE